MSAEQSLQIEIDFLPLKYREECAQRKTHLLRIVSVGVFAVFLLACSAWQWHEKRKLYQQLDLIAPVHESAHERTVRLTVLKNELASASDRAELLIYLHHPWPRTQLLAAVMEPMPESIKLSELTIGRVEEDAHSVALPSQNARNGNASSPPAESKETLTPCQEDLKELRAEYDPRTSVINLSGETTNISELHEYLGQIGRHRLILKAELRSIESGGRDAVATLFRARIEVRPGYGQPNGPGHPPAAEAPTSPSSKTTHQALQTERRGRVGS